MQTHIRRGLLGTVLAGGLLALGCSAASASEPLEGLPVTAKTSGDHSIASGNQVIAPVTAPVTVGAVPAAVLGDSTAINKDGGDKDGKSKRSAVGPRINAMTSGDHSIASGNQVIAQVTAPVTVGAVSAAVLGDSTAVNKDGGYKDEKSKDGGYKDGKSKRPAVGPRIDAVTSGDHSIASGNQVISPVTAPVTVGAVSAAVLGDSTAINKGGGNHQGGDKGSAAGPGINAVTSGDHSIASGNQVIVPVTAPVTVGAVSAAVLGDSTAINKDDGYKNDKPKDDGYKNDKPKDDGYKNDKPKDDGYKNDKPKDGNHKGSGAGPRINAVTSGDHSIASGNQVIAPVTAPVTVGAVSTAVLGDSTAIIKDDGYKNEKPKGSVAGPRINAVTSGDHSIASGNQVIVPVTAPVTVGAVSAAVLGDSTAIIKDDGYKNEKPKGSVAGPRINAVTSGDHSIASGNQVIVPVTAPVTVGAVAAAVLGDSTAINKNGGYSKDGGYKDGNHKGSATGPRINAVTSGDHSIASGNQVIVPVTAPVTVGAVSAAVLGDSTAINKNGGYSKDGGYKDGGD
ncbi:hypothetical protein [Arthrobacter sp. D1-17]